MLLSYLYEEVWNIFRQIDLNHLYNMAFHVFGVQL